MGIYKFNPDDAERFAKMIGTQTKRRGKELQFKTCPYCRADDKFTFSIDTETGKFKCLRSTCGAKGNMITLANDFNFSLGHDADEYYYPRKQYKNLRKYPKPEIRTAAVKYLESRGIRKAIAEKYRITTRKDDDGILTFPFYDDNGDLQFIKYRNTDPKPGQSKEWCESQCKPILFGMDQCNPDESDVLVLTEGQIDSLSVAHAFDGEVNAVSVPTGAKGFTWVPYCWDFLGKFETLIVFGDHENGHITLLDEMTRRFHGNVRHVRETDYRDCKDANELLQKYGPEAVRNAVENAVIVANPKIEYLRDVVKQDISALEKFSTGIAQLDRLTGGFYLGQLILLTGERGNGKSTLASQFGAFAIRAGYNTMFYSGELLDWYFRDWFDRQVAGDRNINAVKSDFGYTDYKVNAESLARISEWYGDRAYLYSNDIMMEDGEEDTLLETVKDAIRQYDCKVIILDNLMTAMKDDVHADLYRLQTKFTRELAAIAKHYGVLIILIAHPRKRYGNEFGNDDVSGSANITNLADVVLRYTQPKEDAGEPDKTKRVLQILKNRLNGRCNFDGIPLYFQESSKRISESRLFDWEFGWEKHEFWTEPDGEDEIPW